MHTNTATSVTPPGRLRGTSNIVSKSNIVSSYLQTAWSTLITACLFQGIGKPLYMCEALVRVFGKRLQHYSLNGWPDRWNMVAQAWRRRRQVLETDLQASSLEKMLTAEPLI